MTFLAISDDLLIPLCASLFLLCPVLFFVGAWLLDRRIRRKHGLGIRNLTLALYSAFALLLFWAFAQVPPSMQFSSDSSTIVSLSYGFGLGWWTIPPIAVVCGVVSGIAALFCLVISRLRPIIRAKA